MRQVLLLLTLLLSSPALVFAQTGKIAGTVTDVAGEPLPGVNVAIEGTTQGATTDADGYYAILNVEPGTYDVRASFIGFAAQLVEDVRVSIDLTSEVDFQLREQAVGLDEVVVTSARPIVQRDVSANVANLSMDEVENIPVTSVEGVVGLQAGIEPGMSVRGGRPNDVAFMVDGMSMRDSRDNTPFTGISYTSVEEVQVQTGGFNAEYGNLRSGLVNVTLKEGERDRYTADVIVRYSPASQKYFGRQPNDPEAYWMRPYLDSEVAFVGTHSKDSPWDEYTRRQYPEFQGWNKVAESLQSNPDLPDLTPEEAQQVFLWRHRKNLDPSSDYEVDGSVGGPVPGVSRLLGDLRFFASYRQTQSSYIVPQRRDGYRDRTGQVKITSDIAPRMKLQVQGLYSLQSGLSSNGQGFPGIYSGELPPYPWSQQGMVFDLEDSFRRRGIFAQDIYSLNDVVRTQVGMHLTHTIGAKTFYNIRLQRNASAYDAARPPERDFTPIREIGGMQLDEAPFGYYSQYLYDLSGLSMGGQGWATARDTSKVVVWTTRADLTRQMNQYVQFKAGIDVSYTDYDSRHGVDNPAQPSVSNPKFIWHRQTTQGAAYAQTKLEFKGMVANLGLRADYFDPLGKWYLHDFYDRALANNEIEQLEQAPTQGQVQLSPRLGVAFPITDDSKFYFNYGHFRDTQSTTEIFMVRTAFGETTIDRVGNPDLPMTKTIAYELGYDQNLFNLFLLRVSGYYKAQSDQPRDVRFESLDGRVSYYKPFPLNYGDVRGAEFTLTKNRGRWVRGFVNYTYMVRKAGNFGFNEIFENRAKMREAVRTSRQHYQEKPVPEPYANMNLEFFTPSGYGPLLGDWRLSFLGYWRAGQVFTWEGGSDLQLQNNIEWRDYHMLDLRLSKNLETRAGAVQLFVDVTNVLNLRHMNRYSAFVGDFDYEDYMMSLHLPEDTFEGQKSPYEFIPGSDQPGDIRKPGVPFTPIEVVEGLPGKGNERALYYDLRQQQYYQWNGSGFVDADQAKLDQVLEDKAYIDMPNSQYFTFLNPRNIFFGVRISL